MAAKPKNSAKPTGQEPERVKIDMPWEQAVKKALGKERPAGGWPKPKGRQKRSKTG